MFEWEKTREQLDAMVRAVGAQHIHRLVNDAAVKVAEVESQVKLPEGFSFFTEHDWMGYNGATRFPDGVRPVIGRVKVVSEDGVEQDAVVVVCAREEGPDGATYKADVELTTYSNDEGDNERNYHATFPTRDHALQCLALVNQAVKHADIALLQGAFGFQLL